MEGMSRTHAAQWFFLTPVTAFIGLPSRLARPNPVLAVLRHRSGVASSYFIVHAGIRFTLVDVASSFNFDAIPAKSRGDVSDRLNHHSPHPC
jgi:hypothetical protein